MATRITQLAQIITANATLVEEHLREKGEPEPSFDINAPKKLQTSGDAELSRNEAIAAATELSDLLKGPAEVLRFDWTENASLRIIVHFDMAAMVPVGSEISFAEIAEIAKLPERDVRRVLRHAMTRHIFVEPRKGFVAHTALSRLLAEDEQQRAVASTLVDVLWPSLLRSADAVKKWPGSEEAEETGFSLEHNPGKTMWQTFSENEEMGRRFGVFIGEAGANESLLGGVEWKGKVIDMGGSHGEAMIDVLNRHPQVTSAVIQDLPDVVQAGQERAPKELADRLKFQAHSFFAPQHESADIYFFRWIFHNWSNKYSLQIIQNLVPMMKAGTKIVVNDYVLPELDTLSAGMERAIRSVDLTMLSLLNATERDVEGWHQLFYEADSRFKVKNIKITPPGIMAIIEVEWQP